MGLSAELRLKIYDYLLTPYLTRQDDAALGYNGHCCLQELRSCVMEHLRPTIACSCARKHLHPQILATCRQIRNEATEGLYSSVEMRIPGEFVSREGELVRQQLNNLPKCAAHSVERLNIGWIVVHRLPPSRVADHNKQLIDYISSTLTHVKHIRLHIDIFERQFDIAPATQWRDAYAVIMTLPLLQTVYVEFHALRFHWTPEMQLVENGVQQAAQSHGKKLTSVRRFVDDGPADSSSMLSSVCKRRLHPMVRR
jgi:hypothetical protein